jgi:hypothetical protein
MKHLRYLRYVVLHRWFVTVECFRRGLYWRGLVHDLSKFLASEWFAYAEHFHGRYACQWRDATGYYKPTTTGDEAFDLAWCFHQNRNDHHWQWWVTIEDGSGAAIPLPMSRAARLEMVCDWVGASRAQGHGGLFGPAGVGAWYAKHRGKIFLHPETREWVEGYLAAAREQGSLQA